MWIWSCGGGGGPGDFYFGLSVVVELTRRRPLLRIEFCMDQYCCVEREGVGVLSWSLIWFYTKERRLWAWHGITSDAIIGVCTMLLLP